MNVHNANGRKLGGPGTIVQIDITMFYYKRKSHQSRNPSNKTKTLVIFECVSSITRLWIEVIADKKVSTIFDIICDRVVGGSLIYTDEYKIYRMLGINGFLHNTVCHKYLFVNPENGVHTQHVESINNVIKCEIKKRKGVATFKREEFLTDLIWKWKNKHGLFTALRDLNKV